MGNTESRRKPRASSIILQKDDLYTVERQYNAMCAGQATMDKRSFDKFAEKYLDKGFRELIFDSMMKLSNTKKVTLTSFVQFAEEILHCSEQQAKWLISFGQPLRTIIDCVVASFFVCEEQACNSSDRKLLVDYLLRDGPSEPATYEEVYNWLHHSVVMEMIVNRVFDAFLLSRRKKVLPVIGDHTLLSPAALCLIVNYLPMRSRYQWTPLYSSEEHGMDFERLSASINRLGACLIIVETKTGRRFGGFASAGFIKGDKYRGDKGCFLFEDHHTLDIHRATGFDKNFAYLNWNDSQYPNGIGMGGCGGEWSFLIDSKCERGTSSSNVNTFEKCLLGGANEFEVKSVEAWRIGRDVRVRFDTVGNEVLITDDEDDGNSKEKSPKTKQTNEKLIDGDVEKSEEENPKDSHL